MTTPAGTTSISRCALEIRQNPDCPLYLFSLSASEVRAVADVSRIGRNESGDLVGYQRPAVKRHIRNIVDYLDGPEVLFPNSLIIAFSSQVQFQPSSAPENDVTKDLTSQTGQITIPLLGDSQVLPGWIVDGQQRSIALSETNRRDLPVPVTAFVTDDLSVQRDQFLRINSVKPLPNGLITELLPTIDTALPAKLEARRVPSILCDRLARDIESPFYNLIKRASTPKDERKEKVVTDTALVRVIQDSLTSPSGCLFAYQNLVTSEADVESIWWVLKTWWTAVRNTFPEAWGRPPRESRLMHSVGIRSMGQLMDRVMPGIPVGHKSALADVEAELRPLRHVCRWKEGRWTDLDGIAWNELQCVTRHIRALSQYLADVHAQHSFAGKS